MRFSLIVATVDRKQELVRFLNHLRQQTHDNVELIIVDQNPDDRLGNMLADSRKDLNVKHVRCRVGVSHARNVGLEHATGDIVSFPDDDCWYFPDLLERVNDFFVKNRDWAGLCGRSVNREGESPPGRWRTRPGRVNRFNVWTSATGYTFFFASTAIEGIYYNEQLGPGSGSMYVSSEDIDFVLRVLKSGAYVWYDPSLTINHPASTLCAGKAYDYGIGAGYVLCKHRYPFWFVLYVFVKYAGATALFALTDRKRASYYWSGLLGRVKGILANPDRSTG